MEEIEDHLDRLKEQEPWYRSYCTQGMAGKPILRYPQTLEKVLDVLCLGAVIREILQLTRHTREEQRQQIIRRWERSLDEAMHIIDHHIIDLHSDPNALQEILKQWEIAANTSVKSRSECRQILRVKEIKDFDKKYQKALDEACEMGETTIPWWVHYSNDMDPFDPDSWGKWLSNNRVTSKLMQESHQECCACGRLIQKGSDGAENIRYVCLDCFNTAICVQCMERFMRIEEIRGKDCLQKFCEHLFHIIVEEVNHPIIKRLEYHPYQKDLEDKHRTPWNLRRATVGMLEAFHNRPCLGTLSNGRYEWKTYQQVQRLSSSVAIAMRSVLEHQSMIGICASNRMEWYVADIATILGGFSNSGIHQNWGIKEIHHVLEISNIQCMFVDLKHLSKVLEARQGLDFLVVVMDLVPLSFEEETFRSITEDHILSMKDFIEDVKPEDAISEIQESLESMNPLYELPPIIELEDGLVAGKWYEDSDTGYPQNRLYSLIFTSGSTGFPKGTIMTEYAQLCDIEPVDVGVHVSISYLPCAWATDKVIVWRCISNGGRVGFSDPPPEMFDNAKLLRPSEIVAPPAILNTIYRDYCKHAAENKEETDYPIVQRYRGFFGDRLTQILTGGAPSSAAVKNFVRRFFQVPVHDGYGTTEAGGIATDQYISKGIEVKLEDVEEMGYVTTDKPYPRGEIVVKGASNTPGYYRNIKATQEKLRDGWFYTGDIGIMESDKRIRIIDRKKNLFKLSIGEFVSPSKLEEIYQESALIDQIFIYGESLYSFLLAAVVINEFSSKNCENDVEVMIIDELRRIAKRNDFRTYEIPKGIVIEHEPWTAENRMLTPSLKMNRNFLVQKYQDQFIQIYERLENSEVPQLEIKSAAIGERIVFEALSILEIYKNCEKNEILSESFSSLGGDSMKLMIFYLRIESILREENVPDEHIKSIPSSFLKEASLGDISAVLESAIVTRSVHSLKFHILNWSHEKIESLANLMDSDSELPEVIVNALKISGNLHISSLSSRSSGIFLTGATGYLGAFILHDLLESTSVVVPENKYEDEGKTCSYSTMNRRRSLPSNPNNNLHSKHSISLVRSQSEMAIEEPTKIYCLVRSTNIFDGFNRLKNKMKHYQIWKDHYDQRIKIISGDLVLEHFGLSELEYASLCREVSKIYHVAANTNSELTYEQLRESNVIGTVNVLELASSFPSEFLKMEMNYISTLSVWGTRTTGFENEDALGSHARNSKVLFGPGYPATKWVSEKLVIRAFQLGLPVTIFRPGFISWSNSCFKSNPDDWVTRFFTTVLKLQMFPFSEKQHKLERQKSYEQIEKEKLSIEGLNLSPVDYVSKVIVQVASIITRKSIYTLVQIRHEDGINHDMTSILPNIYHISNNSRRGSVSFGLLSSWMADLNITPVDCDIWVKFVKEMEIENFLTLTDMFESRLPQTGYYDDTQLQKVLGSIRGGCQTPPIEKDSFMRHIQWIQQHLIPYS